ncbi:MAG: glycosyltransferase [Flavobacteriales bacterium]|nr:glycosyltransferase [Flavobacteriales bacterium]
MKGNQRILVAPLDWGLGHATRCIPVIRKLIEAGREVFIGGASSSLSLLQEVFPQLHGLELPSYDVRYPENGNFMAAAMLKQSPRLWRTIREEHRVLNDYVDMHRLDAVISDNRYGLWSQRIPSVFISHQLHVQAPAFEGLIYQMQQHWIRRFTYCWVPDAAGEENLSGRLSHGQPLPSHVRYVGLLSRFTLPETTPTADPNKCLVILSGPEPQRSQLEEELVSRLPDLNMKVTIIRGRTGTAPASSESITWFDHLADEPFRDQIMGAGVIICRSGYSTLMDLRILGRTAILIPTPGQTEQEYLAEYAAGSGSGIEVHQSDLGLGNALVAYRKLKPLKPMRPEGLQKAIEELIRHKGL